MRAKQPVTKLCDYCGNVFSASKYNVRYCSHECNSKAYQEAQRQKVVALTDTLTNKKKIKKTQNSLSDRPYLSIAEAAQLLGVSRWTVSRWIISRKIVAKRITKRTTRIKRTDLDVFIDNANLYDVESTQERKPIADWYTLDEITAKYGIKRHQIRNIVNAGHIPEKKEGTRTLIAKSKLDAYFKKQGFDSTILNLAEWSTVDVIKEQYNMTEKAVHIFVSRYKIPKMRQDGKLYYSKQHIDKLKNKEL
jgi:excisionase family DNA binding protein